MERDELCVVLAVIICIVALFVCFSHATTRAHQLMLRELGISASYWEAAGMSRQYIYGLSNRAVPMSDDAEATDQ